MNFRRFHETPLFFIAIHIGIIAYCVAVGWYVFLIEKAANATSVVTQQIVQAKELRDIVSTQKNYVQSETYAIRYLKDSLNKKMLGEKVIDTSSWEDYSAVGSFLPEYEEQSGINGWWRCLSQQTTCLEK